MDLRTWIEKYGTKGRDKLARMVGRHPRYLYEAQKKCGAKLAIKIEQATKELTPDDFVPKYELRPDLWSKKTPCHSDRGKEEGDMAYEQ